MMEEGQETHDFGDLDFQIQSLHSGSTRLRSEVLKRILHEVGSTDDSEPPNRLLTLLPHLLATYPRYLDRRSRRAVQECLHAYINQPSLAPQAYPSLVEFLFQESQKPVTASSNAYVLLEWCSLVQEQIPTSSVPLEPQFGSLCAAAAALLDKVEDQDVRHSVRQSALVIVRRALRAVLQNDKLGAKALELAVSELTAGSSAHAHNAEYIGVVADVSSRTPARKAELKAHAKQILDFYVRHLLGSKTAIPTQQSYGLKGFFSEYVDLQDLANVVFPAMEKSILRSAEVVLHSPITGLVESLDTDIDVTPLVQAKLIKPLLSSMGSTNSRIREGASQTLNALLRRGSYVLRRRGDKRLGGGEHERSLHETAKDLVAAFKASKAASHELRGLLSDAFIEILPEAERSTIIIKDLVPATAKEANESTFRKELAAIAAHLPELIQSGKLDKSTADTILKSSNDKRPSYRKSWHLCLASILHNLSKVADHGPARDFVQAAVRLLQQIYEEISSNPMPAAQNGLVAAAYGYPGIGYRYSDDADKKNLRNRDLSTTPNPSFLLNSKVYTKLNLQDDQWWLLKALKSTDQGLDSVDQGGKKLWGRAMLYLLLSPEVHPQVRRAAAADLSEMFPPKPEFVGTAMTLGAWDLIAENLQQLPPSSYGPQPPPGDIRLLRALKPIFRSREDFRRLGAEQHSDFVEQQAVDTVVLLRPELIAHANWIESCLAQDIDPGDLARKQQANLMEQINSKFHMQKLGPLDLFEVAGCNAASTLAFVAPDHIIPILTAQFEEDLSPARLTDVGPMEAAIAHGSEGVAFVDVLAQKPNGVIANKNVKDYDILKWEEEMRAQIAQKRGAQQKKLTADQQAKVDAQIRKESQIRSRVQEASGRIRRGARFIQSLAEGPPNDARLWMSKALTALVVALKEGAGLIVGDEVYNAYIACSAKVNERMGTMKPFIGIATLRSLQNAGLPEHLITEPLGELATRVLYRMRFAAEQRPFDTVSFAYMLPLIFAVLEGGGVGQSSNEDADAQVLLALEFLSYQTGACEDSHLPRADILEHMIAAMQTYPQHYRIIKDSLMDLCRAAAGSLTIQEQAILLESTTVAESAVRTAALQAIRSELDLVDTESSVNIWIACQDEEDDNAELALAIWEDSEFTITKELAHSIPSFLNDPARSTRLAAAKALAQALLAVKSEVTPILQQLEKTYREESQPLVPKPDKYGIVQRGELKDHWQRRSGLALALSELPTVLSKDMIVPLFEFFVDEGALADRHSTVRSEMVDAGKAIISTRGGECVEALMKLFEQVMQQPDQGTQEFDWNNEAVIVLYGSLAQHLSEGDKRVESVVSKLIDTLSTPSESVQYAVALCLPPLVQSKSLNIGNNITSLLEQLFHDKKYASRRGAAYGLAGIVKGKGVAALRQYRIITALKSAAENKKSVEHRQGAMFAYELLSLLLGRTFEPYVIGILPQLLACFGDANGGVREACLDTAKTCFASLSSFGVRKVLPQLLEGLEESQWRSKKGACDLLGAMAYLDPQQLATSLPDIIPPLTAVLTDTHKEVRAAANSSLQRFGEVITNPEVKSLVNVLLKALSDPTKYTEEALDGLIKVQFIHYLDAPSLALVVRILQRGLHDRSSTKRKAAQIIGSLAHLTEKKDIVVHLPILVSGLRLATVDPVPATRATASKALGSLVEKLGEDAFPDLIPNLMSALRTDTGAGDRLGAAQALSEVLAGLGTGRLEETLPSILQNVSSTRATVREGFMTLFIFLPACFGNSFANYLGQIIPSVLSGLADEVEAIRETALRAGRLLVKNFATRAIDLLLPELQRGLADDSHRIRLSSVELVGDLLFSLTGTSATEGEEEQEEETTKQAGQSLLDVLGEERRDKVLSSLYICRCDTSGLVRSAAINVWKALVATPRTLREIVPTLTQMIIGRLASSNMEHKVIAGNALGEVIRKAGEGVFKSLLPSLEEGLQSSTDADSRQGICIALREIVNAASPEALQEYEKQLIAIVRIALVDSDDEVREAAAESFDALQRTFGKRVVDQVLPHLLNLLRSDSDAENALSALLTLLTETTRANVILPNLVPTLLTNPISAFNARALASLAKVAGPSMTRRLPAILNSLADNITACRDEEQKSELDAAFDSVLVSVDEFDGLNAAMSVMLAMIKHDDHHKRTVAARHLANFFAASEVDYSRYNQDLIRVLLISFGDRDKDVVAAAWQALSQLQSHLRKEEMESLVPSTRQTLGQAGIAGSNLPGFALPKGILPVLQIFLQGLMNGTAEQRVQAAMGISDIIDRCGPDSLKPFVTQITGPLIRVVSERSMDVKCAILYTLTQLLEKIPTFLRPFLPQLQRTFTKSIADPSSSLLRTRATKALSTLVTLTPRVDPLITELVTGCKAPDSGVRNSMLNALQEVVNKVGASMSDVSRDSILGLMDSQSETQDDKVLGTYARLLGGMIKVLPADKASPLIKGRVVVQPASPASMLALNAVLLESAPTLISSYNTETVATLTQSINSKTTAVQQNAVLAAGKYLLSEDGVHDESSCGPAIEALSSVIQPGNDIDTRRLSLVVVRTIARHHNDAIKHYLPVLVPAIFASVRDAVIPIKLAAEAAFLEVFNVVDEESAVFDEYMKKEGGKMADGPKRVMGDYFKRVALRLGGQARERREAEGGNVGGLGLTRDERDDEREVWGVGRGGESEGVVDGE